MSTEQLPSDSKKMAASGWQAQTAIRVAREFSEARPDWVTFFREILGVEGVVRKLFPTPEEFSSFEASEEYREIQGIVRRLRAKEAMSKDETRVITLRLPSALLDSLKDEAKRYDTSLNRVCIRFLMDALGSSFDAPVSAPAKPR